MNTGCIALKPCEVTACVRIKKIGFWRLSYVELNIIKPAENDFFSTKYWILNQFVPQIMMNRPHKTCKNTWYHRVFHIL